MKHEIYVQVKNEKYYASLSSSLESLIPYPFKLAKLANGEKVLNLLSKCKSEIKRRHREALINGVNIHIDANLSDAEIEAVVAKLSGMSCFSVVEYHGVMTLLSDDYQFPALKSRPEKNPDFMKLQHLFLSPLGLDAMYGWTFEGGTGEGINIFFSDIEINQHPDLEFTQLDSLTDGPHGTQVMGFVGAKNNDISCMGIVPDATLYLSWFGSYDGVFEYGKPGDVVNLSIGYMISGIECPWTAYDSNRALIKLAAEMGVTSCYASTNTGANLDNFTLNGKTIFNKNSSDYEESYGICVGGVHNSYVLEPERAHNYGSLVDVFAQSVTVNTLLGSGSGTSFSTPMIAGLVAQIQSIYIKQFGHPLTPEEIRSVIGHPDNGSTASVGTVNDKAVMPDLRRVLSALGITPGAHSYPVNYNVTDQEINDATALVNAVFKDATHTELAGGVTLADLYKLVYTLYEMSPGESKVTLHNQILGALALYDNGLDEQILDDNEFLEESEAWHVNAEQISYTPEGVILAGGGSGVPGVFYNHPVLMSSSVKSYTLSAEFRVLEWDGSTVKEAIIGGYAPQFDLVLSTALVKTIPLTENENVVSLDIANVMSLTEKSFPGFGVRGAKKILLRKMALLKNDI